MTETPNDPLNPNSRLDRIETNLELLADRMGELAQSTANNIEDLTRSTSSRLNQVEANLEAVTETLVRVASVVERNRADISELFEQSEQTERRLGQLTERMDTLTERMDRVLEQAAIDREAFQAESRRIWEYLLSQKPNGRGNEES